MVKHARQDKHQMTKGPSPCHTGLLDLNHLEVRIEVCGWVILFSGWTCFWWLHG